MNRKSSDLHTHLTAPIVSFLFTQQRFTYEQSLSDTQPTWYVPLDYINGTGDDWSSPTKTWLNSETETEMVVNDVGAPDSWLVFNVNKTGWLVPPSLPPPPFPPSTR